MNLIIDNRKSSVMYVDTYNLHYGDNKDIIKFIDTDNTNPNHTVAKLIGISKELNDSEVELLAIIYDNIDNTNVDFIKSKYDKSVSTFNRSLNSLIDKYIVKVISNIIVINEKYNIARDNNKRKFVVIELKPDETSKGIKLF